ncbi:MAG TPA: dienelactone hydrolase family protein [Candidatus Binatia bacterium]|nr:dienelactone hydrolase family protein [Candidatus Binatia bacterium]
MQALSGKVVTQRLVGAKGTPAFLAHPEAGGPYPCIVILHERYGLVKHTEDLAERLAGSGYVVIAPDLFHAYPDQDALHRGDVGVVPADSEVVDAIDDVIPFFGKGKSDPSRLGLIGVCQTGRYAIVYGAQRPLQAAVTLYGAAQQRDWPASEKQPVEFEMLISKVSAPVLGIFGEKDHVISIADVQRLRNALEKHDKSYQITVYGDAPHGWLNDTMPGRYRPEIAKQSWDEMVAFFDRTLSRDHRSSMIEWKFSSAKHADYDFTKNVRLE